MSLVCGQYRETHIGPAKGRPAARSGSCKRRANAGRPMPKEIRRERWSRKGSAAPQCIAHLIPRSQRLRPDTKHATRTPRPKGGWVGGRAAARPLCRAARSRPLPRSAETRRSQRRTLSLPFRPPQSPDEPIDGVLGLCERKVAAGAPRAGAPPAAKHVVLAQVAAPHADRGRRFGRPHPQAPLGVYAREPLGKRAVEILVRHDVVAVVVAGPADDESGLFLQAASAAECFASRSFFERVGVVHRLRLGCAASRRARTQAC